MRVLVATSAFPLRRDAAVPRSGLDLCEALSRHVEVTVLAPGAPDAAPLDTWGALDVRRFAYFLPQRRQCLAYGPGVTENLERSTWARVQVPTLLACQARAVRRVADEVDADVVHSDAILPAGLAAAWARGRRRRRFAHVTTLDGSDSHLLPRVPAARALARWICHRSDAIVAVSSDARENLDRVLGRSSGATLLPVGVDTAHFRAPVARPVSSPFPGGFLLFAGRLVALKGVDVLLAALPRVRERHPELGLVVLGDGPLAPELREDARRRGLADWVRFAGEADREQVAAHLHACRAAVVPSVVDDRGRAEGTPAVALEALAAGARLVASDAGGVPDVVSEGRNGWLSVAGDPEDLAAKILAALDAPVPTRVGAVADSLDWSRVAERTIAIYERALKRADTP